MSLRSWIGVTLTVGAVAAPLRAQVRPPSAGGRAVIVTGVVFDSLGGGPLEGARVFARGGTRVAVTDRGGRFRLDSVSPGVRTIMVEHDSLEAVGLPGFGTRIQVSPSGLTVVELGVPSHWTLRRRLCRDAPMLSARDTGVVYGTVRDAETGDRLSGAMVRVSWLAVSREGGLTISRPNLDVRTDSVGNYYACSVPVDYVATAQAFAGRGQSSGVTELLVGPRGLLRHDLRVSRDTAAAWIDSGNVRRGTAAIIGRVRDTDGRARPGARVLVDDTNAETYADPDGRFLLTGLPSGSHMLMARSIGYAAARRQAELRAGDTTRIELVMRAVTVLDTIRVTARSERVAALLDELDYRLRTSQGQVLRHEDLARRATIRSVFQGFAGIRIEGRSTYSFRVYSGINCPVSVYVDGLISDFQSLQSYRPDQFVAVEYFPRATSAPFWAQGPNQCGVALVWTRFLR